MFIPKYVTFLILVFAVISVFLLKGERSICFDCFTCFFMINLDKKYRKISFLIKTINNGTRHTIEFGGVLALERVQEKEAPPTCRFFLFL